MPLHAVAPKNKIKSPLKEWAFSIPKKYSAKKALGVSSA